MPTSVEDLLVRIDATTESLRRELKRGEDETAKFGRNVDKSLAGIDASFATLGKSVSALRGLIGPLAAALGGLSIASFARDTLRLADNIEDTAGQLQISTQALQAYRYAAEVSGVESGALENAIAKLTARLGDAVSGEKAAVQSFRRLKIAFENADGSARSTEQVLADLADRIQSIPDPAQRAAAAAELLGQKAGPRLVALLSGGAEELTNWLNRAREAGQVMSDETIKRLAAAEQAIVLFQNRLKILAGETITAVSNFVDDAKLEGLDNAAKRTLESIEKTRKALADPDIDPNFAARLEVELQGYEKLAKEIARQRAEILGPVQGHSGRGGSLPPKAEPFILPPAETDTKKAAAVREVTSALDAQLSTLRQQIDLLGEEGKARAELEAVFRAQEAARRDYDNLLRDSPLLSEAEIENVREMAGAVYDLQEAQKGVKATVLDVKDATNEWGDAVAQVGRSALQDIAALATGAANATDVLAQLAAQLADILADKSGLYDLLGSALGSLFTPNYSGLMLDPNGLAPGRAVGGGVRRGMPYLVGEKGPELFVPSMSGDIMTAGATAAMMGGGPTINVGGIHVTAQGGTPQQNLDSAQKHARAVEVAIQSLFDERLGFHLRPRGMLQPNAV